MKKKKIVIIGGGVAGLTAGIYLQQAGFESVIYEKHTRVGGECTGWKREGYQIDNCIHWLTGTKEGTGLNDLWTNIGALGEGVTLNQPDFFFSSEQDGEKITFWRDLEKTRQELIALSPEDKEEIDCLIDYTKLGETMDMPVEKPFDKMNVMDYIKLGASMAGIGKLLKKYGKIDISEMADRFKHPLIRMAINDYMPKQYQAYALLLSYATITAGNGGIPEGGSVSMVMRVKKRYEDLGGIIRTGCPVKKMIIKRKRAIGIMLEQDEFIAADYVVCACDTDYTFRELLDKSYMPKELKLSYEDRLSYPVVSGFHVAFAVDGYYPELDGMHLFGCEELRIASESITRLSCKGFYYEPSFSPEGKGILQSTISQSEADYQYWIELYEKKEEYNIEKMRLANEILSRLVMQYPCLEHKIRILDVWTPATYQAYYNAYHGAYMSFIVTKHAKNRRIAGKIKGLPNVFLASQWLMGPGGLPTAAAMGKFAAQRIIIKEQKK